MENSILIKNGQLVSSSGIQREDLYIESGKIVDRGEGLVAKADRVIDAGDLFVIPGVLDPQVHFRDPGTTHKEDLKTGSMSAAAGGVTGFFDMPNNKPSIITTELMAEKKKTASEKCVVNYNFFIGATAENLEVLNTVPNVCGIKIFMGASTGSLLVDRDEDLENIFAHGNRLIAVHAEDNAMLKENMEKYKDETEFDFHRIARSPEAALKATKLAVSLSQKYNRRLHVLHLTTQEEAEFLAEIKKESPYISTELCPQHFLLKAPDDYQRLGSLAQTNPPIRDARHGEALWKALKAGVIDCMATDHAPHTLEEKDQPFGKAPSGMPGVETLLPHMLNQVNLGNCSIKDVVRWLCEKPVELYGVVGKGYLQQGFDADITLVDLKKKKTIRGKDLQTKVKWTSYEGMEVQGWPIMTIVGGQVVYENEKINEDVRGKEILIDAPWEHSNPSARANKHARA